MNLKEIVTDWLKSHGYDGLCNPERECGCSIEDLFACDDAHCAECQAGRKCPEYLNPRCECEPGIEYLICNDHECLSTPEVANDDR